MNHTEEIIGPDPVIKKWSDEYERARQAGLNGQPLSPPEEKPQVPLEDFKARLTVFEKGFLSDSVRDNLLTLIYRNSKFDIDAFITEFAPGSTYCLAVVPFDEEGYYFSEDELKKPDLWFRKMRVHADGMTEDLFNRAGYYYDLFPSELKENCKFTVPAYKLMKTKAVGTETYRPADMAEFQAAVQQVLQSYADCYAKLRHFLDTPPIDTDA
jgi:hypothetical protein